MTATLMTPATTPPDGGQVPAPEAAIAAPAAAVVPSTTPETPPAAPAAVVPPTPPTPPAPVVPETYTLALSEKSTFDASLLERAGSLAKELQLPNEPAQKIVSLVEEELDAQLEVLRAADAPNGEAWKARVAQYENEALLAPDLGNGDRAQLETISQRARMVAEKFGGKEMLEFLGATGSGSNQHFLRMFNKLYAAMGEGTFVQPNAAPAGKRDPADVLFTKNGGSAATTKE